MYIQIIKFDSWEPYDVTAILFACSYVIRWGKFGRVFCKQTSVAACKFQNECNKVEIALRVVQFWSEIKLVITNRTPASRSCDFVITRLISDQIALHSVQLPLLITLSGRRHAKFNQYNVYFLSQY